MLLASAALGTAAADAAPSAQDTFSRAVAASLGTADSGQAWQNHAGGFSIDGGQAVAGGGYGLATLDAGAGQATVSVTVAQPGQEFWLVLRLTNDANFWRFGRSQGQNYQLQQVRDNGLASPALTILDTASPAAGDRIECRSGSLLQCSVNGTPLVRTADTTGSSSGKHGLSTWSSAGVRFDDFSVVAVPQLADLVVSLTAPAVAPSGGSFDVTATVVNSGPAVASNAVLEWSPPAGLALAAAEPGSCSASGSTISCPVGDLPSGGSAAVTLAATAPTGNGSLTLPVRASHQATDAQPNDNAATASVTLRPDLSPDTVVSDGFSRADAAGLGRSDTGALWTTYSGHVGVAGEKAAPGNGYTLAAVDAGESSGQVAATVTAPAPEFWLVFRMSGPAEYWRFGRSSGGAYELQQVRGSGLGSPALDRRAVVQPEAGDRMECELSASIISCSVDGVVVVRSAESFNRSADLHGLAAYNSPGLRLDDFLVERRAARPDLRTTMTGPATLPMGTGATVTTTVSNAGQATATGTSVRLTLPEGLSTTAVQSSDGSCVLSGRTADCTIGTLPVGASATISFVAQADSSLGTRIVTAQATATQRDDETADNDAASRIVVVDPAQPAPIVLDSFTRAGSASLGSTDTGQAWHAWAGSPGVDAQAVAPGAGHTLATVDAGTATGIVSATVTQPGSEFWLILRAGGGADYWRFGRSNDGSYQLQLVKNNALGSPSLTTLQTVQPAAGDRLECRVAAVISCGVNGQTVVRTADTTGAGATSHGLGTWNSPLVRFDDFQVLEIPQVADLSADLTGTRSTGTSGTFTLKASVTNSGTANAPGATLDGTLPAGLSAVTVTGPQGACPVASRNFQCALGSLAPAAVREVTVVAVAPAQAGTVTTTVTVAHAATDGETANNTATLSTAVRLPAASGSVVRDEFERSASGGGLGTADSGEVWQTLQGGFTINGGEAASTSTSMSIAAIDAGFSFGTYEVTVADGATQPFWLTFRVLDANNYFRLGAGQWSGEYTLTKVVNGVERGLPFNFTRAAVRPAAGDVVRLVLRPDDGIYVYVNGQEIIDAGDPEMMDVTGFGIAARSTAPRLDGLQISQVLEAFPISDTFSRADADTMGAPEVGTRYPWRNWAGWWGLQGGRAYNETAGYGITAIDSSTESAGASAKVAVLGAEQWLVFRYAEDGSYYRYGATAGGSYAVQFVRGGDVTNLPVTVQTVASRTVGAGDVIKVVQRLGGAVETLVNGVVTHRFTDATSNIRATIIGMATSGSQARFDDFAITLPPS